MSDDEESEDEQNDQVPEFGATNGSQIMATRDV